MIKSTPAWTAFFVFVVMAAGSLAIARARTEEQPTTVLSRETLLSSSIHAGFLAKEFDDAMTVVEMELARTGDGPGYNDLGIVTQDLEFLVMWASQMSISREVAISRYHRLAGYFQNRQARVGADEDWRLRFGPRLKAMVGAIPSRN